MTFCFFFFYLLPIEFSLSLHFFFLNFRKQLVDPSLCLFNRSTSARFRRRRANVTRRGGNRSTAKQWDLLSPVSRCNNIVCICIQIPGQTQTALGSAAVSATKIHSDGRAVVRRGTELTVGRPSATIARTDIKLLQYLYSVRYFLFNAQTFLKPFNRTHSCKKIVRINIQVMRMKYRRFIIVV